jgi:hypothetical protein
MAPVLREGDLVTIVPGGCYRLGEIILFPRDGCLVLHRVVAKSSDRLLTKGDAAAHLDPPLPLQNILGRAVCRERQGRISALDSWSSRVLGLAFSLTLLWVPGLLPLLAYAKRRLQKGLGFSPLGSSPE